MAQLTLDLRIPPEIGVRLRTLLRGHHRERLELPLNEKRAPEGAFPQHLCRLAYLAFALDFLDFFAFLGFPAGRPRLRAYLAMNSSVFSRASESGRCVCGDFIR